jgi:hypothetical protein
MSPLALGRKLLWAASLTWSADKIQQKQAHGHGASDLVVTRTMMLL